MKYSTLQQIPKNEARMSGKKCNVSTVSWQKRLYARTFYLKENELEPQTNQQSKKEVNTTQCRPNDKSEEKTSSPAGCYGVNHGVTIA